MIIRDTMNVEVTIDEILREHPQAFAVDGSGREVDLEDLRDNPDQYESRTDEASKRVLVWMNEISAENDPGYNAIAEIELGV